MRVDVVVLHYNEIALKLGHRPMFVARLVDNVRLAVAGLGNVRVHHASGRILVEVGDCDAALILQRLAVVPGIANCLPLRRLPADLDALDSAVDEILEDWRPQESFAVSVRRADKRFPGSSPQIAARVGARIVARTGARVDLTSPDCTVQVLVLFGEILLGFDRVEGCGGLPVSTGGRLLLLLSGGIDSPVAGLRMQRRGARIEALHFHSVPYLSAASQDKARQLAGVIARGQQSVRLWMVPFGDAQAQIVAAVPRPLRVVLYRRMMMRIAGAVGYKCKARALVTGESLGQVASQTLSNMLLIERASRMPVLRPLVGMDKLEISRYADREGCYEISILPDQDCCTLFVPRHPATAADEQRVLEAEALLDVNGIVKACCDAASAEIIDAAWPDAGLPRVAMV